MASGGLSPKPGTTAGIWSARSTVVPLMSLRTRVGDTPMRFARTRAEQDLPPLVHPGHPGLRKHGKIQRVVDARATLSGGVSASFLSYTQAGPAAQGRDIAFKRRTVSNAGDGLRQADLAGVEDIEARHRVSRGVARDLFGGRGPGLQAWSASVEGFGVATTSYWSGPKLSVLNTWS